MATFIIIAVLFLLALTLIALRFARANFAVWVAIVAGWGMLLSSATSQIGLYLKSAWDALVGA